MRGFKDMPSKQNICITFVQCWTSVEDVWPTLYECYTNVLCFPGTQDHDVDDQQEHFIYRGTVPSYLFIYK